MGVLFSGEFQLSLDIKKLLNATLKQYFPRGAGAICWRRQNSANMFAVEAFPIVALECVIMDFVLIMSSSSVPLKTRVEPLFGWCNPFYQKGNHPAVTEE